MNPKQARASLPGSIARAVTVRGFALVAAWLAVACDTGESSLGSGPLPDADASVDGAAGAHTIDGAVGTSGVSTPGGTPTCAGLVSNAEEYPMTALDKPALHTPVVDPEFGTRLVRVTDVASEGATEGIVPMYSTIPAWNANETRLLLLDLNGNHRLYDGRSYEYVRRLDLRPADVEQVYWHPRDGDILYYVDGNRLIEYSVSGDAERVIHTFSDCETVSAGDDPMYISWDGNAFGVLCEDTSEAFVYRVDTDTESVRVPSGNLGAQVSPSGELVFLDGDVYDRDMNLMRRLPLGDYGSNASLGQLANGQETLNTAVFDAAPGGDGTGTLVVFDLETGSGEVVVGQATGYPYPPSGTHVSAVAQRAPGWVAVSIEGDQRDGQDLLDNELLLVDTNSNLVCRIGHHRSHGQAGPRGYWASPHVVVSPSATRVVFGSDWGGGETVDSYVVELPSYAP